MQAPAELLTIRDWLRYAVSRFNAANLSYGHGTTRALDDAAFLILATLDLPVDEARLEDVLDIAPQAAFDSDAAWRLFHVVGAALRSEVTNDPDC